MPTATSTTSTDHDGEHPPPRIAGGRGTYCWLMEKLDATSFDFWLGTWDCEFEGGHAVNTITR
jgi:hypothetical protein